MHNMIKSDSTDMYNVTKYLCQINAFLLNYLFRNERILKKIHSFHKNIKQDNYF